MALEQMKIDWRNYLDQFDLVYQMQSRVWQDGTVLGNGSLGAMAFEPFHLEWTVNKNDVWDYRHHAFKRWTMAEVRQFTAEGKNYAEEMIKENLDGYGKYPCPKTCGQLRLRFGFDSIYAPGHRISKRLNLYTGTLHTQLDKHLSHPRVSSFVAADRDLLIIRVRGVSAMTAFNNMVDLYRVPDALLPPHTKGTDGDSLWIEQTFHGGLKYVMMARVVPTGEAAYGDLFRATVQEKWWYAVEPSKTVQSQVEGEYAVARVAGDFDVYLTVATNLDDPDPMTAARKRLAAAVEAGSDKLHEAHARWWADFWTKCYVGLDEPLLEQLWYLSLYHLGSALRGTPVGGLCGLWYGPMDTPSQLLPWMGSYTNDYNAQLPIMPVFRVNHPELADGSFRTLLAQLPNARRSARTLYELPGAFYPISSDPTGEEVSNGPYRFCQGSGPYWSVFLWWHYLYTKDVQYLKEVSYPVLREVAAFFVSYLQWHEDEQLYHLEISQNPELMYVKYPDPVDTLAMLKYALKATIEAAGILGMDKDLIEKCQHVLNHYPPYARNGLEISPLRGLVPNHINHMRTLAGVFPCGEWDPEIAPDWSEICRSEITKNDFWSCTFGCNEGRLGGWTGCVYHVGLPACRLGMKEQAWKYLEYLLKCNVKPNGMIAHNGVILANSRKSEANIKNIPDTQIYHDYDPDPLKAVELLNNRMMESTTESLDCKDTIFPALEGPAVYLLLVGEMLLQSQNGIVRLFPGLPDERDAAFADLRAEGPILVSSRRRAGQVDFVSIRALAEVQFTLNNPWPGKVVFQKSSRASEMTQTPGGPRIMLALAPGETVTLAVERENLAGAALLVPRRGEVPQARQMKFRDGMAAWLGKPQPSRYYAILEDARGGLFESRGTGE